MPNEAALHIILALLIHHYSSSWALPRFAARHFNQHHCQHLWIITADCKGVCICVCVGAGGGPSYFRVGGGPRGRVCKRCRKTAECPCFTEILAQGEGESTVETDDRFIITEFRMQRYSAASVWGRPSVCHFCWSGLPQTGGVTRAYAHRILTPAPGTCFFSLTRIYADGTCRAAHAVLCLEI